MNYKKLQEQKLDIIAQIAKIDDDGIIQQIKTILDDSIEIPDWHKKILDERENSFKENPESYINAKDFKKTIIAKLK